MKKHGWTETKLCPRHVRKRRRADELTAAGKTREEIAAELGV